MEARSSDVIDFLGVSCGPGLATLAVTRLCRLLRTETQHGPLLAGSIRPGEEISPNGRPSCAALRCAAAPGQPSMLLDSMLSTWRGIGIGAGRVNGGDGREGLGRVCRGPAGANPRV
eukprot:177557-Chlamydomonas_euryale.AAC.6